MLKHSNEPIKNFEKQEMTATNWTSKFQRSIWFLLMSIFLSFAIHLSKKVRHEIQKKLIAFNHSLQKAAIFTKVNSKKTTFLIKSHHLSNFQNRFYTDLKSNSLAKIWLSSNKTWMTPLKIILKNKRIYPSYALKRYQRNWWLWNYLSGGNKTLNSRILNRRSPLTISLKS